MDATTRWETEALRDGPSDRRSPPRPTAKRRSDHGVESSRRSGTWVTLREAEASTGIPVSTLRKWVRRAGLDSYLESDGENPVRMVDLGAVQRRARELGRDVPGPEQPGSDPEPRAPGSESRIESESRDSGPETRDPNTMLVPVDAWNKMLNQLGNLHEAGQQLADARERAAKAETEVAFLRSRLAELRTTGADERVETEPDVPQPESADDADEADEATGGRPTTSFLRYVTVGWRNRTKT